MLGYWDMSLASGLGQRKINLCYGQPFPGVPQDNVKGESERSYGAQRNLGF